jgi:hypothetical protein
MRAVVTFHRAIRCSSCVYQGWLVQTLRRRMGRAVPFRLCAPFVQGRRLAFLPMRTESLWGSGVRGADGSQSSQLELRNGDLHLDHLGISSTPMGVASYIRAHVIESDRRLLVTSPWGMPRDDVVRSPQRFRLLTFLSAQTDDLSESVL